MDISMNKNKPLGKMEIKRVRRKKYMRHLKSLYSNSNGYSVPVIYKDEIYIRGKGYIKNQKPYYKRQYRSQSSRYYKKLANRKVRRFNGELSRGGYYKRIYDFYWNMY